MGHTLPKPAARWPGRKDDWLQDAVSAAAAFHKTASPARPHRRFFHRAGKRKKFVSRQPAWFGQCVVIQKNHPLSGCHAQSGIARDAQSGLPLAKKLYARFGGGKIGGQRFGIIAGTVVHNQDSAQGVICSSTLRTAFSSRAARLRVQIATVISGCGFWVAILSKQFSANKRQRQFQYPRMKSS